MECSRCHAAVNPGALFCGNCGLQFATAPGQTTDEADVAPGADALVEQATDTMEPAASAAPSRAELTGIGAPVLQDRSGLAIASFVLGILGLPAVLIPILGVIFGMLAIVFGSISLHSVRKVFAKIGIGVGVFIVLVSVFFWIKATQDLIAARQNGQVVGSAANSGQQQVVSTPCYTTKVPAAMKITKTEDSCTFLAVSPAIGEQIEVKVLQVPELTAANLATAATSDITNVVGAIPGGSIASQSAATFAGSQAYSVEIEATDGSAGTISYVYGSTVKGNLVIVLHTQARATSNNYDLSSIESAWSWL